MNRHKFYYILKGIDKTTILQDHNSAQYGCIIINSVDINTDDRQATLNVTISNLPYDYQRFVQSNNGNLILKIGNYFGGHSRKAGYHCSYSKKNPAYQLKKNYTCQVRIPYVNGSNTVEFTVPLWALTDGSDIDDSGVVRVQNPNAPQNWNYIIYKAKICMSFAQPGGESAPDIMNSDTIKVFCTFDRNVLDDNSDYTLITGGRYPWTYDGYNYVAGNHEIDNSYSTMILIPKITDYRYYKTLFDYSGSSETDYDYFSATSYHNYAFINGYDNINNIDWPPISNNGISCCGEYENSAEVKSIRNRALIFRYVKDQSSSEGDDTAYVHIDSISGQNGQND